VCVCVVVCLKGEATWLLVYVCVSVCVTGHVTWQRQIEVRGEACERPQAGAPGETGAGVWRMGVLACVHVCALEQASE
jgi:hypothetical protein